MPNRGREVGGGRSTRQPGQVRKEAALTRTGGSSSNLPLSRARSASGAVGGIAKIIDRPRAIADGRAAPIADRLGERRSSAGAASTPRGRPAAYRVLARKYRPSSFDDLIGQEPMVRTLPNAFDLGRIHQAYILTGVRGVGKTTTARILARAFNYELPARDGRPPSTSRPSTWTNSACIARRSSNRAMST